MIPRWQTASALLLQYQWNLITVPQTELLGRPVPMEQARLLGGGSSLNIMLLGLGAPAEFDTWAAFGNPGWDFEGLSPYLKKVSYLDWFLRQTLTSATHCRWKSSHPRMLKKLTASVSLITRNAMVLMVQCPAVIPIGIIPRIVSSLPRIRVQNK